MTEIICPKLTINGVETTEYQGQTIRQINYNGNTYVLQTTPTVEPFLTFSSPSSFTLKTYNTTKNWDGTLEYSTDKTNWLIWDGTTTLSSASDGANYNLYLRGIGNTYITGNINGINARWVLAGNNIACTGNIENLLDYQTVALGNHPTMNRYCYQYMFYLCSKLTTAPALPATTLTIYCYYRMFYSCNITTLPELPAITLTDYCYNSMFRSCTKIKLSKAQIDEYQTPYRIPTSGTGTTAVNALNDMFAGTGGSFTETPSINTKYFTSNTVV